ncbi:hypothetical protein F2Q69_00002402 [Brassica cretica]|uniref:Uncharacterized protein n=1 Tax=Brassica cretica TaxID=69181 RepID=A0A8S9P0F5_BRACR|nr:hypothetical protein F2Q69_00002402 [Brassica cretica]
MTPSMSSPPFFTLQAVLAEVAIEEEHVKTAEVSIAGICKGDCFGDGQGQTSRSNEEQRRTLNFCAKI